MNRHIFGLGIASLIAAFIQIAISGVYLPYWVMVNLFLGFALGSFAFPVLPVLGAGGLYWLIFKKKLPGLPIWLWTVWVIFNVGSIIGNYNITTFKG